MLNLNKKILNTIFKNREEELYKNTYKSKIVNKNKNEKYYELINNIKNLKLKNDEDYKEIINCMDNYLELINRENAYLNERFYKSGFKDGMNLVLECM